MDSHKKKWYSKIPPKVLIEKMLIDSNGNVPKDYKIHCFNKNNTKLIMVDSDRFSNHKKTNI